MLILTENALYRIDENDASAEVTVVASDPSIVRVCAGNDIHVAATDDGRILAIEAGHSEPIAADAESIDQPIASLLILEENPLEVLVGTEGARLYRVTQVGCSPIETFDALECRGQWHTPWGGPPSVRTLAGTADGTVYADIHVGSIMRSRDAGETWTPVSPSIDEDVHQVVTSPMLNDWVLANTARGVYLSEDRGKTWSDRGSGLGHRYGRSIAVSHDRPKLILAGVSDGPHGQNVHGQLYRSTNAGTTWEHIHEGFPESTRENINTHHISFTANGLAWACVEDRVYLGRDSATLWEEIWRSTAPIRMLSTPDHP